MANAYNLTTKERVKTHLDISGSSEDTFLDALCDSVTAFIEKYCGGQRFFATEHEEEIHDGNLQYIRLRHRYLYTDYTVVVEVNGGSSVSPSWTELSANDFELYPDAGVVYLYSKYGGKRNIRVTYKAGFSTIPEDIQLAATLMVARMFNRRRSSGLSGESFEGVSQNWNDTMTEAEKVTLDNYRQQLV